jgi:short-subunit dehydrogenase
MATALVTGATAGIGNAFARRLAADGHDLVLVARDEPRLQGVAEALRSKHGVRVEVLAADLLDRDQLERVAQRLRDGAAPIDLLINNAGFSKYGHFVGGEVAAEELLIDILIRAVLVLTHAAVPGMVSRGYGTVINVSSVASFLPGGTYSAAKAWVTTFTASLSLELAGTGVTATALCPGYTRTELHARAGFTPSSIPSWAWLNADKLVDGCLADVHSGKSISVPSLRYKVAAVGLRHMPFALAQQFGRMRLRQRGAVKR